MLDLLLLKVPGACDYQRLLTLLLVVECLYLLRGFIAIHDWHLAIHKNQAVRYSIFV